jgi:hypothetical protein
MADMKLLLALALISATPSFAAECITPWGVPVPEGQFVTAYYQRTSAPGQVCMSETRFCENGFLSGSYLYPSCVQDEGCQSPTFGYIPNGGSVTAYESPFASPGQQCQSQIRICMDGTLSGFYDYASCSGG